MTAKLVPMHTAHAYTLKIPCTKKNTEYQLTTLGATIASNVEISQLCVK